jgi:hypothetical protein
MIIGVSGNEGSGKTTVAAHLHREFGFVRASFTAPMNRFIAELYGFTEEQLSGASESRNEPHPTIPGLTARIAQKKFGMAARELFDGSYVESLFRRHQHDRFVVIENVRFANEIAAVRARGGYLIRCRGGVVSDHPTETEQLSIPDSAFDVVLERHEDKRARLAEVSRLMSTWLSEAAQ